MQTFATAEKGSRTSRKSGQSPSAGCDSDSKRQNARQHPQVRGLLGGKPLQTKLKVGKANDALEREADRTAAVVISMPRVPVAGVQPAIGPHTVLQPKCSRCEDEIQRQTEEEEEEKLVQAKKSPGGSTQLSADQALGLGLSGGPGRPLSLQERTFYEPRFGHDFSRVRLHDGNSAAQAAKGIGARAFTRGRDIVFGQGERNSSTRSGRLLLAHELSHVIQQGQAAPLRSYSAFGGSTADTANPTAGVAASNGFRGGGSLQRACACGGTGSSCSCGGPDESELQLKRTLDNETIQRDALSDFVDDPGLDTALGVAEAVGDAAADLAEDTVDAVSDAAAAVWGLAHELADALGAVLTVSGGQIIISVPRIQVCPSDSWALQFSLPQIGVFIPVVEGVLPLTGVVNLYGAFGVHLGLTPEIGLQLGPCHLDHLRIVIDPLAPSFAASTSFSVTSGASLGAVIDVAARGEVGVLIIIPDPPIPIQIPVAGIEVGLTGQTRGIAASTLDADIRLNYSSGTFSFNSSTNEDIGLAADLGLGAYGAIDVLGMNLCRLNWPLWEWHGDMGLNVRSSASISVGRSGASASVSMSVTALDDFPYDEVPLALSRDVLEDDCPLCDALQDMGLMPSQRGGAWTGHPAPAWGGPLHVYPRDPGIASGAHCRGACGPDCDTCHSDGDDVDKKVCEQQGDFHSWHVYPNYVVCDTHDGCRQHDACYDWCAAGGESTIIGPCHRLCDFECLCNNGAPSCVGWIFGSGGDDRMYFSDAPYSLPGCRGPCPHEGEGGEGAEGEEGAGGGPVWGACLDPYPLFDRHEVAVGPYHWSTGNITLWEELVWDLPPVTVELYARGDADAALNIGLGPAYLTDMCLTFDPDTGDYSGTAALVLDAYGEGVIGLTGFLGGGLDLLSFDFLRAACAEGYLRGEARPRLDITGRLHSRLQGNGFDNERVPVNCDGGDLTMETGLTVTPELSLTFELSAGVRVELGFFEPLRFQVWNGGPWTLHEQRWSAGWEIDIDLPALAAGVMPAAAITAHAIDLNGLVGWLMDQVNERVVEGDAPEEQSLPGCGGTPPNVEPPAARTCEEVIEDPLTVGTAKNVDSIKDHIDDHDWSSDTFTLPTGGSETVGVEMESPYLTSDSTGGSNNTRNAQPDIYGFRKLPQDGAFGGDTSGITRMSYVKGHLLRGDFGGPVTGENLYPITRRANNPDHFQQVERPVEQLLGVGDAGRLVYYKVRVVDQNGPNLIDVFGDGSCTYYYENADFDCTWATYKLCRDNEGGELVERNPSQNRQIHSNFDVNGFIQKVRQRGCPQRP